jgi:uncharacterized protein YuzE
MRLEYDLNVGALYISLTSEPVSRTVEVGDNAAVDLDAAGRIVGIEVISTAGRWPLAGILATYEIHPADAAQLKAYFMPAGRAPVAERMPDTTPVVVAAPTAPWTVPDPVAA